MLLQLRVVGSLITDTELAGMKYFGATNVVSLRAREILQGTKMERRVREMYII